MPERQVRSNPKLILYTSSNCSYCDIAKNLLLERSVEFEEVNCSKNPLFCLAKGIFVFPTLEYDGKKLRGKELLSFIEKMR